VNKEFRDVKFNDGVIREEGRAIESWENNHVWSKSVAVIFLGVLGFVLVAQELLRSDGAIPASRKRIADLWRVTVLYGKGGVLHTSASG